MGVRAAFGVGEIEGREKGLSGGGMTTGLLIFCLLSRPAVKRVV